MTEWLRRIWCEIMHRIIIRENLCGELEMYCPKCRRWRL